MEQLKNKEQEMTDHQFDTVIEIIAKMVEDSTKSNKELAEEIRTLKKKSSYSAQ